MLCCFQNYGTQDLFSFLAVGWKPSFAQFLLYFLTISVPVGFLKVEAGTMRYRVEFHLQTNDDW